MQIGERRLAQPLERCSLLVVERVRGPYAAVGDEVRPSAAVEVAKLVAVKWIRVPAEQRRPTCLVFWKRRAPVDRLEVDSDAGGAAAPASWAPWRLLGFSCSLAWRVAGSRNASRPSELGSRGLVVNSAKSSTTRPIGPKAKQIAAHTNEGNLQGVTPRSTRWIAEIR